MRLRQLSPLVLTILTVACSSDSPRADSTTLPSIPVSTTSAEAVATSAVSAVRSCQGGEWVTLDPLPELSDNDRIAVDGAGTAYRVGPRSIATIDAAGRAELVELPSGLWLGNSYPMWISLVEGDAVSGVWLGSPAGVIRLRDGNVEVIVPGEAILQVVTAPEFGSQLELSALTIAPDGSVVVAFGNHRQDGPVLVGTWADSEFRLIDVTASLAAPHPLSELDVAPDGTIWGFSPGGLLRIDPDETLTVEHPPAGGPAYAMGGYGMAVETDGTLWVVGAPGVSRYQEGEWTFWTDEFGDAGGSTNSVAVATDGAIWVSAYDIGSGAYCYDGVSWRRLSDASLYGTSVDLAGRVWLFDADSTPMIWIPDA